MPLKNRDLLFVSTNGFWGGSETLWSEAAAVLAGKGHTVAFALRYSHPVIQMLKGKGAAYTDMRPPALPVRVLHKLKLKRLPFLQALQKEKPRLVVLSQGNNVDGKEYMTACRQRGIPYVTVTQLVTDMLLTFINDEVLDELRAGYAAARVNYFVSQANLEMHTGMVGEEPPNAKTIKNPFTVPEDVPQTFPPVVNGRYSIALVGRLQVYHKGHDLLLQVLQQQKWKDRPVTFHFYGDGPHRLLLERLVKKYGVGNAFFKGHVQNVADVWTTNHLLVLPSRMEGQALALVEAMWCYRPSVVTDVGGARQLVTEGDTGFVAALPTVEEIDAALERAWLVRDQWEAIGRRAGKKVREVYDRHPIASFVEEIETVLATTGAS